MKEPTQINPNSGPNAEATANRPTRSRRPALTFLLGLLLAAVATLTIYSIYVAVHVPDPQETVILGQSKIAAGSPAAFRILVRNRVSDHPVAGAKVELALLDKSGRSTRLGVFQTDATGSISEPVAVPELPPGAYQLIVDSRSALGSDHVVNQVEIQHPARILFSSDKPIYQPGQTIHLRTLVLNGRTEKPLTNEPVIFEVSDPKGNKVFKETLPTSSFGIASADFVLANEPGLGRYEARAMVGPNTAVRTLEIKRYALPKFKIQVTTDKPYYQPGQTVSGSVQADYFFGKPVGDGETRLTVATFQEKPVTLSELRGKNDATGKYSFQFVLPDFFAGMPQKNGQAFLDLSAEVRDTAGHAETKTLSLSVSQNELEITAIPEAGAFLPGVENVLYVLTSYPDGRPAVCRVYLNGTAHETDAQGICEVKLVPSAANQQVDLQAMDAAGHKARLAFKADPNIPGSSLLLRTDKALYQAGDTAKISILSPEKNNTVFIDIIKDGQTVLTRSLPLSSHKAEYSLGLPAGLVGALTLNAYVITENGEDRGCSRLVYVNPASAVQIAAKLSQPIYRPGEIAKLDFSVTDAQGHPVPAALGIAAVDESVFALAENRPGLLQQFLETESDLLKPRYQIKWFDSPGYLLETGNQSLAKAWLATLSLPEAGPSLDRLIESGDIPRQLVDHVRALHDSPAYEQLRRDPRYAEIIKLLDGRKGPYSLREATGPTKVQAVEMQRQAYFRHLRQGLLIGFLALLFALPLALLTYFSRPGAAMNSGNLAEVQSAAYVRIAGSLNHVLAAMTLLPLLCYPTGMSLFERQFDEPGWILLGFEVVVVLAFTCFHFLRIQRAAESGLKVEMTPLRVFLCAFLGQFLISRAGIVLLVLGKTNEEWLGLFWGIGSLVAPLVVLGSLNAHTRRQLAAKGIPDKVTRITVFEVVAVITVLFLLAGLLLPALASAKAKAQRASLQNDFKQIELAMQSAEEDAGKPATGSTTPRVRRDFPETLLWRPELITDDQGRASLEIPLADSITTWRTSVDGITASGRMGSTEVPIPVFQDFFVDLDLPATLSLGDEVSVPVACYNYLKEPQDVHLALASDNWFETQHHDLTVRLAASEVKSVNVPIKVLRAGTHVLRVTARGSKMSDALERDIRVVPTGEQIEHTLNEVLKSELSDTFVVPVDAIPDSQSLNLKFYPSRFSEVVEGLDSIFQAPYGCFEQTSSTTYPNVLVLDYMKRTGRLTPEIEIKARKYINAGYQRLLTFEVPGGGFEWFGHTPAHVGLTAYGVLEFADMSRIHPVDQAMLERTRKWLYSRQQADGSWEVSSLFESVGFSPATAYVAWALAESGDQSPNLDRALNYLRSHSEKLANNYEKALAANALLSCNRHDAFAMELLNQLKAAASGDGKLLHWNSPDRTMTFSHGNSGDIETTALCVMAMIKAGAWPESVKQSLAWLSKQKTSEGSWGTTQATILAMRALLAGAASPLGQELSSTVSVLINGEKVETFALNKDNSDVMKQIELTKHLRAGENRLELRQSPAGELPVQIGGLFWRPKSLPAAPSATADEPLAIAVQYDRTALAVNDLLQCSVTVRNNNGVLVNMAIVDLGIPPGFDVDTAAFEAMQQDGRIAKFEVTGNQVILYLRELSNAAPFLFNYSLRAKYPLRVQAPPSTVYEYYQPQNRAVSKTAAMQVEAR